MVKKQVCERKMFYTYDEIARPSRQNIYTQLNEAGLDWERIAKPFSMAFSAEIGRPTDPVVYLKIFLVAYLENITYDTELAERISDSIAIRAFLGYDLSQQTPDHSSISRNRDRIAQVCSIDDVLSCAVQACADVGLVGGELGAVDSSLVPANASLSSLKSLDTGKSVREHLMKVKENNKDSAESGGAKKQAVSNEEFRSTTDPDARIAKKPGQPKGMYYKATHVTDSKNGIIICAGVECADKGEVESAKPVVKKAKENLNGCGLSMGTLTADAGYGSADFHAFVEDMEMVPVTNWRGDTTKKPEGFKKESFVYYKEANCYICPKGCILRYHSFCKSTGLFLYKSHAKECANCADMSKCIDGKGGVRTIGRHPREESRERNIARCHTDEGRAILKARKHIVEPPFGHMKTYGGLGRINCRGKAKAYVKIVMAAVAYNLIKLVRFLAKKKKEAASAAMLQIAEVQTAAQVAKMTAISTDLKRFLMIWWPQWLMCAQLLFMLAGRNTCRRGHAQVA